MSLADTQSTADERYARAKADNAVLQARVHMLDEQIREIEFCCEERIAEEQRRCRDAIARVERDRDQQLAALNDRLTAVACTELFTRNLKLAELVAQLSAARDAERREREAAAASAGLLAAAKLELQKFQEAPPPPPDPRLDEPRKELTLLRTQNKSLSECGSGVEEGRSLLDGVSGPLVGTNSRAHELEQLDGGDTLHSIELEKLQKALKEQQDVNVQLRNFIDGILLSIVENCPLLEDCL